MYKKVLLVSALMLAACEDNTVDPVPDPTLRLSSDSLSVAVGGTAIITASINNAAVTPVFASRDSLIARVNASGTIVGVSTGTTFVVGSTADPRNGRDSVRVVVTPFAGPQQPITIPLLGTGQVTERFTAEVAAAGQIAYTSTWGTRFTGTLAVRGDVIKVWNVAGNTPVLIDSLVVPGIGTLGDVQISDNGNLLVAAMEGGGVNNGIAIFNRSNPNRPTLIRRYAAPNTSVGVHTVKLGRINNRLYAFLSINNGHLIILDITDPANPVEVFDQAIASSIHDVFIRDGVLFTALWQTGMRIYDVGGAGRGGTPSNPVALGTVQTGVCRICSPNNINVHNIWWFHDPVSGSKRYAFVGEEGPGSVGSQISSGAIHVVDVSDFNAPREVAVYEPAPESTANAQNAGAHNFVMDEPSGILYAAYYNGGVRALDVRGDLSVCTTAQKTADGRCDLGLMGREVGIGVSSGPPKYIWGVALVGNHLYASDMPNGIHKLDISALRR